MTEQLPRHDQARREADGSEPHDMRAPARLIASREGKSIEIACESAARAMQLAMAMLHHSDGIPDRIILDDDSLSNLEARASRLVPATIYSRALAGGATAA